MGAYHTDLAKNVARCRDSEVRIQRALKLANVDLGCLNVMASPSLFLHFFRQLVFPCSYLIRGTIPTSLLVLVKNIFTPFIYIIYIYIYIYAPYVRLTVNFHLQHGQDGRPLRSPLRATQILATDTFKREGNRTIRSGHYNLSPRQGYRHRKKEYRQLIFLRVREFHSTLSEVVSRSPLYTMPTGTPLRRTLSNTTASENLLPLVFSPSGSMGPIATVVY